MGEVTTVREAVAELVNDGDSVALEGFTHLIPTAAGHEIIRQERRNLTLIRMTPDLIYDQMIGMGCASKLIFSWGGNPGVGSLHRFRDAVENGWPRPLEIEEHSHAGMANRYVAGASNLPVIILRQKPRFFVEDLAFVTSVGHRHGGETRKELGYGGGGPTIVITDLGILRPDPETKELTMTALHPGTTVEEAKEATGWELEVADELETTDPPTERELEILRDLKARTEASRKKA